MRASGLFAVVFWINHSCHYSVNHTSQQEILCRFLFIEEAKRWTTTRNVLKLEWESTQPKQNRLIHEIKNKTVNTFRILIVYLWLYRMTYFEKVILFIVKFNQFFFHYSFSPDHRRLIRIETGAFWNTETKKEIHRNIVWMDELNVIFFIPLK